MKKILYISVIIFYLGGLFSSCNDELEPVFDKDPSQRIKGVSSEYLDLLTSSKYGWLLQYFPNSEQKYGGYSYFLDFKKPNKVEVKAEKYLTSLLGEVSVESDFDLTYSSGVLLTFNTYNKLLHYFANPNADEYLAKQGDFEFRIMSKAENEIILKGTKTGNHLRLVKMKEPVDDYIAKQEEVSNFFLGTVLKTEIGGATIYPWITSSTRNLDFSYTSSAGEVSKESAFTYTNEGIHLFKPLEVNGVELQEFTLDKVNNKLISSDGKVEILIKKPEVLKPFIKTNLVYVEGRAGQVSDKVKGAIQYVSDENANNYSSTSLGIYVYPFFRFQNNQIFMEVHSSTRGWYWNIAYQLAFTTPNYDEDSVLEIVTMVPGKENGNRFFTIDSFVNFVSANSPYKVEEISAKEVKITSVKDTEVWYILNKL